MKSRHILHGPFIVSLNEIVLIVVMTLFVELFAGLKKSNSEAMNLSSGILIKKQQLLLDF